MTEHHEKDGTGKHDGEYTDADPIEETAPKPEAEGEYTDSELPDDAK